LSVASIILTGFMATGKSEVGRRLAHRLGRPFVDTDALVQDAAGRSVAEVFATEGEARFRALERDAVVRACAITDAVVATGGGTLIDAENRARLAAAGTIVCLTASPEVILERAGDDGSRPLLGGANGNKLQRIRDLLDERAGAYRSAAHAVDTTGLTVDEVVDRVGTLVAAR
jgi:shikimate kinase